ncbi:MAG: ABC transporter permease [Treponema sp.]|nr:ABC transporter permease [Treponema sp.]
MEQSLSLRVLAAKNIRRKAFRSFALAALVTLSAAVLSGSFLLASSLRQGISGMQARIGADLMIVPEGCTQNFEQVLLSGEPNYFYMDRSVEDTVRGITGVRAVTSQFYLTSLSETCCDFPVQIIGFDPESDFLIKPWVQQYAAGGALFTGSNVTVKNGGISFFGQKHAVSAKLAKSGTGMDNAVFTDLAGVQDIFNDARDRGYSFVSDGDVHAKTSAVFVRLEDGAKADSTALRIRQAVEGVQVIQQGKFIRTFADKMNSFILFLSVMSLLFLLVTVLALALSFSLSMYERKREFSILRVLGASRSDVSAVILHEAFILGSTGSVCGIFLAALVLLPFSILIAQKIAMPFCMPAVWQLLLFAALTFVLLTAACVLSALHTALRIARLEIYAEAK